MRILDKKYIHILGTFRIVYNFYKTQYVHVSTESKERPRVQNINWEIPIFALAEIFFKIILLTYLCISHMKLFCKKKFFKNSYKK